eukprot:COSAG02_NODE_7293_length_3081_cov_18.182075_1_plen_50_part_00
MLQLTPQLRAQGMPGLEEVDVSRLSVAECLALAEKQDTSQPFDLCQQSG